MANPRHLQSRGAGRTGGIVTTCLLSLGLAVHPLLAQTVRGTVRDSATLQPLPGVVVTVLDSGGTAVRRAITDESGRYQVFAAGGLERLRLLRIGFRPLERSLASVASSGQANFMMAPIPLLLESVRVTATPSLCPRAGGATAAFGLLEQVRAGLLATVVARLQNRAWMKRLLFERRLDFRAKVLRQSVRTELVSATDRPFGAARTAASLIRDGFRDDRTNTFFAPDAETLMDDEFANGYCFRVIPADHSRPHQVGLGFEPAAPIPARIDISGVLWVDSAARALHDIEFRYLGLDSQVTALEPGGRVSFREMPNGIPLIDTWSLRLVSGDENAGPATLSRTGHLVRPQLSHLYVHEIGGELARASWPDGVSWKSHLGALRLRVVTRAGTPAPGVVVRLDDTDYAASTDSTGEVRIDDVLPGTYTASIADPQLTALEVLLPTRVRVSVQRDSTTAVRVELRSADDFVRERCAGDGVRAGGALIVGRVVEPDGHAAGKAGWSIRSALGDLLVSGGHVDGNGLFQWCRPLPVQRVEVQASRGNQVVKRTLVLSKGLTIIRLVLPPPSEAEHPE